MLNKLYFSLSVSTNIQGYNNQLRYIDSPVMFIKNAKDINYTKILLLRKLSVYCIKQLKKTDLSGQHTYWTYISDNSIIYIISTDSTGNSILMLTFSINFAGAHFPGKQPLSKTAVIISRTFIEPAGVQSVTKV